MSRSIKTCVVTGASKGLGLDIVLRLSRDAHRIYALVRNPEAFTEKRSTIPDCGPGEIIAVQCDVRDPSSVAEAVAYVTSRETSVDLLVNNAGIAIPSLISTMQIDDWIDTINTNLTGVFLCSRLFLDLLRASQGADIINVSSRSGRNPAPKLAAYCASKFGLNGLTEVMQIEFMEYGVRVTSIAPGRCATTFADEPIESWHIPASAVSNAIVNVIDSDRRAFWGMLEIRPVRRST